MAEDGGRRAETAEGGRRLAEERAAAWARSIASRGKRRYNATCSEQQHLSSL